jgi:hypothetical protein
MRYKVHVPKDNFEGHVATLGTEFPGSIALQNARRGIVAMNIETDLAAAHSRITFAAAHSRITSLIPEATVQEDTQYDLLEASSEVH